MNNDQSKYFSLGYAYAVANYIKMYGHDNAAEEMYRCNFISVNQLRALGAQEDDIQALSPVINTLEVKRKSAK